MSDEMKRALLICAVAFGLSAFAAPGAQARAGDLDPSFGEGGRTVVHLPFIYPKDMAIDSKGRIVIVGVFVKTIMRSVVVRLSPDGSLDQSFGHDGIVERPTWGEELVSVETDEADRILLAGGGGALTPPADFMIARLLEDGRGDPAFDGDGVLPVDTQGTGEHEVDLALDDRGGILLASGTRVLTLTGRFVTKMMVLRVDPAGFLDSGFGGGGVAVVDFIDAPPPTITESKGRVVTVDPEGRILVAGTVGPFGPQHFAVARFDARGQLDPTFAGDGTATIDFGIWPSAKVAYGIAVDPRGRPVLAGTDGLSSALAARLLPNGSPDPSFAEGGTLLLPLQEVSGVGGTAVDEAGRILIVGSSTEGGAGHAFLARLREDGSFDDSFGAGGLVREDFTARFANGLEMAIDSAGRYLIMGEAFSPMMGAGLARYLGDSPPPAEAEPPRCRGKRATIVGTAKRDRLRGTPKRDVIVALGGNDRVRAFAGRDLVCAGSGRDVVRAGKGNDTVFGGRGADRLFGGAGKDRLRGGPGRDRER
jgi:uncharacterized delta-60 repeat protein